MNYDGFFTKLTSLEQPHERQQDLAATEDCRSRLIRIPTGFGKTLGVLAVGYGTESSGGITAGRAA